MKIHAFKAFFADKTKIADFSIFCDSIKRNFSDFKSKGLFKKDETESLFVTEISYEEENYMGIVCMVDYSEMKDNVLKHEDTKIKKEKEVISFLTTNKVMVKPVLLAFDKNIELDKIILDTTKSSSLVTYHVGDEIHKFWKLKKSDEELVTNLVDDKIKKVYIADGHHRSSTISTLVAANKDITSKGIFSVLFSFDQLSIKSFTRVVKVKSNFIENLKKIGEVSLLSVGKFPVHAMTIVFLYRGNWYSFLWNKSILDKANGKLCIELFSKRILKDIFEIEDERKSTRIEYLEGNVTIEDIEHLATLNKAYFLFKPISKTEFKEIINQGKYLPPKATWFEPRIKSGLINTDL